MCGCEFVVHKRPLLMILEPNTRTFAERSVRSDDDTGLREKVCVQQVELSTDISNISWNPAHHFSSRPDCHNTAEVPSSILRTAFSAIPLVSQG